MEITGAELFVKALKAESVTTLFAYPGVVVVDLPKDIQRAYGGDRYQTQVTSEKIYLAQKQNYIQVKYSRICA